MPATPRRLLRSAAPWILTAAALGASAAASAHTGVDAHSHHDFSSGLAHPFFGLDHLAAMLAVGLWSALAARRAGPELLWGPVGFSALLLVGAVLGIQRMALPAIEPMIAASLLVTGLLVVSRLRLPGPVAAVAVGGFALFHGLAHGLELADSGSAGSVLAGMLCATVLLHAAGLAAGWALRQRGLWLARVTGAAVAAWGGGLLLQML
jgi:urease accessory protein